MKVRKKENKLPDITVFVKIRHNEVRTYEGYLLTTLYRRDEHGTRAATFEMELKE